MDITTDGIKKYVGKISAKEVDRLHWLGTQVPENGVVVELGGYAGMSTAAILSGLTATARMVTLDLWLLNTRAKYNEKNILESHIEQTSAWNNQLTRVIGDARLFAETWRAPIDFLFVDTAKDRETIEAIWKAWLPHCTGWIASHDFKYNRSKYQEVVDVVTELCVPITDQHHHVDYTWSGKIIQ